MKASFNEQDILSLLEKVRIFNKDIGQYQLFAITENFDCVIKLSNGKILLKIEELEADEEDRLTPEALAAIADRFVPAGSKTDTKPPAFAGATAGTQAHPERNNKLLFWSLGAIVLILLAVFGGLAYIDHVNEKSNKNKESGSRESYKERVMSVKEQERADPTRFLSAGGEFKQNLFGTKFKIDFVFKNQATLVAYRDAVVRVTYYDDEKAVIGTEDFTVNENFPPRSETSVRLKVVSLKNSSTIDWKLVSAKVN